MAINELKHKSELAFYGAILLRISVPFFARNPFSMDSPASLRTEKQTSNILCH